MVLGLGLTGEEGVAIGSNAMDVIWASVGGRRRTNDSGGPPVDLFYIPPLVGTEGVVPCPHTEMQRQQTKH